MSSTALLERPTLSPPASPGAVRPPRPTSRRVVVVAVAVALLGIGVAVLVVAARPSSAEKKAASISSYMFMPGAMTLHVGDTVTWTNSDTAPHTVTSSKGPAKIDSPTLAKGDTFSYTFTVAGTYEYFCAIHPDMKGTVTVLPAAAPATPAPPPAAGGPGETGAATTPAGPGPGESGGAAPVAPTPMPSMPAAPAPPAAGHEAPTGICPTTSALTAMLAPLVTHLDKAHLETSPGQQVADLLNLDQYTKTHTVLLEAIVQPLLDVVMATPDGLTPLMTHLDKAHLETSPGQQVADLLSVDQYVKTHTVLAEAILAPGVQAAMGTAAC